MLDLANYSVILGSASPRRRELLESLRIPFEIRKISVKETIPPAVKAMDAAAFLAEYKGSLIIDRLPPRSLLITADTAVICDGDIMGKPRNKADALEMITRLSQRRHTVVTGVCIQDKSRREVFSDTTYVQFSTVTPEEAAYYVDNYQVLDKAGAYGIQDWIGRTKITEIEGSFYNVMGLPVHRVYEMLRGWSS